MERIAEALQIEPLELRRRNIFREGSTMCTGQRLEESVGASEALEACARKADVVRKRREYARWNKRRDRATWRGIGIAVSHHGAGFTGSGEVFLKSRAAVTLTRDGDIRVLAASTEIGHDDALAETYIPGRELSVAVMDGQALGVVEIRPHDGFYDYEAKYTEGRATHIMPAPIDPGAYAEAMRLAERAHAALGCRGVTRADLRYDDTSGEPGRLYLLEINTQPGMTPLSLVPEIRSMSRKLSPRRACEKRSSGIVGRFLKKVCKPTFNILAKD